MIVYTFFPCNCFSLDTYGWQICNKQQNYTCVSYDSHIWTNSIHFAFCFYSHKTTCWLYVPTKEKTEKNVNEPFIKNMYEPSISLTCHIAGRLFVLSPVAVSTFQTKLESETQKLVSEYFRIPLTDLPLSHLCACQKPRPGFPLAYVMVCSIIEGDRWLLALFILFVIISTV